MKLRLQKWLLYICLVLAGFAIAVIFYLAASSSGTNPLQGIFTALQPIFVGCIMMYLLHPVCAAVEHFLLQRSVKERVARGLSILAAVLLIFVLLFVIGAMLIPELLNTGATLSVNLRSMINEFTPVVTSFLERLGLPADWVQTTLTNLVTNFYTWLESNLSSALETLNTMAVGLFSVARFALNLVIGLIVMIYMLYSRDHFIGQGKKILYAVCTNRKIAAKILQYLRKVNQIFSGFITGKVIDSLIIGCICFIVLSFLRMPYTPLISVIVGVTNFIPVFGPFIGAIPCAFLLLLTDPAKCLIFVIFIIILQQIDGNIIGPMILGDSTGLPAFWVLVALFLFQYLLGFWGLVVGVPLFASFYYLAKEFINYLLTKRSLPTTTDIYVELDSISESGELLPMQPRAKPPSFFRRHAKDRTKKKSVQTDDTSENTPKDNTP